jgi:hypothetical protein
MLRIGREIKFGRWMEKNEVRRKEEHAFARLR